MNAAAILADPGYLELKERVIGHTGLAYYESKDQDLAGRILRRFTARGAKDCESYLKLLKSGTAGQQEMDALIAELTIGETYFFRQAEQFEALREMVLPDLIERRRASRCLRIWSAGCATGAEPYSVALVLARDLGHVLDGWDVGILGTDINRHFLTRAREARFDEWAFREGPEDLKTRHFLPEGKQWILRPEHKRGVSFQYHNLVADPPLVRGTPPFDLILCRNVMIYFNAAVVRAIVGSLYDCLAEGGWLLVGHAEPGADVFRAFRHTASPGVYQKIAGSREPVEAAPVCLPAPPVVRSAPPPPAAQKPPATMKKPAAVTGLTVAEVRALADRGEFQAAQAGCRKLLETDGINPAVHFTLALILDHTGSSLEAERSLRRAIYLDRGFVLAHYHLGLAMQKNKDRAPARRAFENVLELLKGKPDQEALADGDGITAGELKEMARMHLELLDSV